MIVTWFHRFPINFRLFPAGLRNKKIRPSGRTIILCTDIYSYEWCNNQKRELWTIPAFYYHSGTAAAASGLNWNLPELLHSFTEAYNSSREETFSICLEHSRRWNISLSGELAKSRMHILHNPEMLHLSQYSLFTFSRAAICWHTEIMDNPLLIFPAEFDGDVLPQE